jgi:hypothetical protein
MAAPSHRERHDKHLIRGHSGMSKKIPKRREVVGRSFELYTV